MNEFFPQESLKVTSPSLWWDKPAESSVWEHDQPVGEWEKWWLGLDMACDLATFHLWLLSMVLWESIVYIGVTKLSKKRKNCRNIQMMQIKKRYAMRQSFGWQTRSKSPLMLEVQAIFYFFTIVWAEDHQHRFDANVSVCQLTQPSLRQMPLSSLILLSPEFVSFSINYSSNLTTSEVKKRPFYSTAHALLFQ